MTPDTPSAGRRDAEKRWSDPNAFRAAARYAAAVLVVGAVLLVVFAATGGTSVILGASVPAVFGVGGLLALGIGFAAYRRGRMWVYWQGAAWALLALMLVALPLALTAQ
ncbi:hypothetical protein L5G28_10330 [Gordonia sp. HY285]|uniref:hypothetical protein n=1 Tax=Gordonia liuliyuniae TaxID=2911517 RepID=UPI001F374C32|nr:hypothetical protein [Gordonia liuliyuniae]MCF8610547.1 hypothetical protein [Gordonia liuliyuniae]